MTFKRIASGHFLEGLAVDNDDVFVADVVKGGVFQIGANGKSQEHMPGKMWIGSLAFNEGGYGLSGGMGSIAWFNIATLTQGIVLDHIGDEPLDGVNEVMPDSAGGLYFGTIDLPAIAQGKRPGPSRLCHLSADGHARILADNLAFSNGIGISPDGKTLYHNETWVGTFAYAIAADGSLGPKKLLLEKNDADGMAIDQEGALWVTGFNTAELLRLSPGGAILDRLPLPEGQGVTNMRFGGPDYCTLSMTMMPSDVPDALARGIFPAADASGVYQTRMKVPGYPIPPARLGLTG